MKVNVEKIETMPLGGEAGLHDVLERGISK